MCQHIEELASKHDILVGTRFCRRPYQAYAIRELDEVQIAPIRSALSYAVALHEIGHILGRFQHSKISMTRERNAWQWARENGIVWMDAMERYAQNALAYCARRRSRS